MEQLVSDPKVRKAVVDGAREAQYGVTTKLWRQGRQTRFDAPLVAAAYNAGGIYYNAASSNRWRLRQYPLGTSKHVDRFVDARKTPYEGGIPSFARLLP